ncbi:hypothetical protein VD0002_g9128 [Verticillium dahliae]|nr:hypothetical protein VD0003_g9519 [Verticillium dahliae]PNH58403.1 hypothetical protein VD0002_g9128 [Verticillium dahliae]RBQ83322.1 hypothetical protein VDGD_20960 [Verticillium dahliae]
MPPSPIDSPTDSPAVTEAVTEGPIVSFTADTHEELLKTIRSWPLRLT